MPQLINVAKTDTFEEQRTKINNLAADVYNLQTQSGATAFVALTDTPTTFTADKWIRVDSSGSSLEWFDGITKLSELTNDVGYLTSFTETDPTVPGHVKSITTQNIADWNEAHGWGDHSQAGYLTTDSDTTYTIDLIQSGNTPVADEFKLQLTAGGSGSGTDIISFKAGTGIEFEGLNANGSDVTIKSTGGGGGATTLAALTDTTIPGTITTGHVLKWDGTTWGPAPDSTSTSGSGIALTDISVVKPNPAASGNGDLTYNDVSGQFTFTPADVPSNLSQLNNDVGFITGYTETDPTVPSHVKGITAQQVTNWDEAHGWGDHSTEGYLKGIGSLSIGALSDVDTTGVANNKILKYNGTSWVIADDNAGSGGTTINSLGDINDVSINNVQGDQLLKWDGNNWINFTSGYLTSFTETDPTVPAHVKSIGSADISNWNDAHGWGDHSTEGYLTTESDPTVPSHVKGITTGDINSWNAKSDVSALNDLSDVNTSGVGNGKILKHNGTSWVIGDDTTINTLNDIGDVNVGTTITDGYVLKWDNTNTQWVAAADLTGSATSSNTYVTYLNGEPRWSEQTAANNYQEAITYQSASTTGPGGVSLLPLCDGNDNTFVNMGCGHADMSFLWLSQAALTDVVKITVGFDGHGWIGYGSNSGISTDSATLLRVDNGQAYGANGVTGSPTEIIVYDNNSPAYSGQLQTLTFVEYPDANGTGGSNRGPGSRCHVYYFKITRSLDNVLTEITYNFTSGGVASSAVIEYIGYGVAGNINPSDYLYDFLDQSYDDFTATMPTGSPWVWNNFGGKISPWNLRNDWTPSFFRLSDLSETTWSIKVHPDSVQSGFNSTIDTLDVWRSSNGTDWQFVTSSGSYTGSTVYNITAAWIMITNYGSNSHEVKVTASSASGGGIALTDLSVLKPNPAASGNGDLTYSSINGQFTYTPPDLSGIPNASKISQWDTAYGWGDHSAAGYLTSFTETDPTVPSHVKSITQSNINTWNSALTSYTETDPVFVASAAYNINSSNITNWNSAYGWGDHSTEGYLTSYTETDPTVPSHVKNITAQDITNWNNAGSSGITLAQARQGLSINGTNGSATATGGISYDDTTGIFTYSPPDLSGIPNSSKTAQWDTAYGWGDHSTAGYLTSFTETDPTVPSHVKSITSTNISNWNSAYGWGDHSAAGYTSNSGTVTSVGLLGGTGVTVTNSPVTSSGNINIELDANLNDIKDVNVGLAQNRTANTYLRWTGAQFDLASVSSSGGGIALTDISVASPHPAASGNGDLSYNASNGEFTYTPANVPTNVSQLTNDSGFVTSESDPVFSSHAASNVTTTKISQWDTAYGWGDHSTQGYLTSASAPSGVPSGTIVMYNSGSAPSGWAVCDGSNGTPDLRGRFIVAAGGSYSGTGGSADAVVVSHSHGYSSFSSTGDHTHSVSQSSTNVSNQSNHTHPAGNYAVSNASGGSHSHSVDFDTDEGGSHTHQANINANTGNQSANHTHTLDTSGSGFGGGGHSHTQPAYPPYFSGEDSETGWGYSTAWNSLGVRNVATGGGNHSHSLTHATLGISENHSHSMNFNVLTSPPLTYSYHDHGLSGNTSSEGTGSHSHPFSGSSGGGGSHNHSITMSFTETSTGDHTHSFSIDSQGQSGSGKNLPPYYTLTYIMKL
tara:strand:+ start:12345 stop:17285 length:4941 start_codon:yes stop_codon:yes gene_type:complete